MRIVSLIASGTEIVAALGQAENIVGRSHGCDFPALVKHQPVLTEAKCHHRWQQLGNRPQRA